MTNIDDFFVEQEKRMNVPGEDIDEYIQARLVTRRTLKNQGTDKRVGVEALPHMSLGFLPRPPSTCVSLESSRRNMSNPSGSASSPGPVHCAKRYKKMAEDFISTPMDCVLPTSAPSNSKPDPNPTQWTAQSSTFGVHNSLSPSADLVPACDLDSPFPQTPRTAVGQAMPVAEEVFSAPEDTPGSGMKVGQRLKRRRFNASPPTSDHPLQDAFSTPSVSSRRNPAAAARRFTPFDGHGSDGIDSAIVGPSSSDNSRKVFIEENPAHAGFNVIADPDCSNITSPTDIQSSHARSASRWLPTDGQSPSPTVLLPVESGAHTTLNSDKKSRVAPKNRTKMKDKQKLTTPLEYAQKLQSSVDSWVRTGYLKEKRIFYVGGDMKYASTTTKGRMEYIMKHGGTLVPKYDPAIVTHIVTDAGIRPTLRALSLKSLSDIPNYIPTVTWSWVVSECERAGKRNPRLMGDKGDSRMESEAAGDHEDKNDAFDLDFLHAAFPQRIDAGRSWEHNRRSKHAGRSTDVALSADNTQEDSGGDISHISAFSQENKPAQTGGRTVPLTVLPPPPLDLKSIGGGKIEGRAASNREVENADPLAEYYAQARADREAQWNQDASDSDDGEDEFDYRRGPVPRRGFTCDIRGSSKATVCVNQHIVDKLNELKELHKAKPSEDDRWRAYSYGKCIPAIRNYSKPIRSFSEARSIRGVGEKTALKIMEILNTGDLKRIKYEATEDVTATRIFQGIYGVGRYTAFSWFASGLRTLDDVRARKCGLKLSTAQETGLKFYDDINSRMPREEARKIFEMIKPIALEIDNKLFIEIMGSFRRGKADCGDIDILITRPTMDGNTHRGVLRTLLGRLHAACIITEDLAVPDDFSDLELIYRGLCKLPEAGAKRRRIDFLCVPWESRGAALLYYTGDDIFNRAMRLKANKHGYSLNQRGLYAGVLRDPRDRQKKVCEGHIVASETEEEIFKILGVPWQEPHERVRG